MKKENLERLLNTALEFVAIYEDSGLASQEDLERINALFDEVKYSDSIDCEMDADAQAQDWDTFGEDKI